MLEYKPKFDAAAIYAPIGFDDEPIGPYRPCDAEAREMIGWPRVVGDQADAVARGAASQDSRRGTPELEPWLTNDDFRRFRWLREAEREFQPFHQRKFFAAHPGSQLHRHQRRRAADHLAASSRWGAASA